MRSTSGTNESEPRSTRGRSVPALRRLGCVPVASVASVAPVVEVAQVARVALTVHAPATATTARRVRSSPSARLGRLARAAVVGAAASAWLSGCAPTAVAAGATPAAAGEATPDQALQRLVGNAACDGDAQCRTVAVGHKACGGPEAFVAYSTASAAPDAVERAAAAVTAAREAAHPPGSRMSTCSVVQDPGASCAPAETPGERRCRLRSGGTGGAASVR